MSPRKSLPWPPPVLAHKATARFSVSLPLSCSLPAFNTIWHRTYSFICSSTSSTKISPLWGMETLFCSRPCLLHLGHSLLCIRGSINIEWLSSKCLFSFFPQPNWEILQCRGYVWLITLSQHRGLQKFSELLNQWMITMANIYYTSYVPRYSFRSFILI